MPQSQVTHENATKTIWHNTQAATNDNTYTEMKARCVLGLPATTCNTRTHDDLAIKLAPRTSRRLAANYPSQSNTTIRVLHLSDTDLFKDFLQDIDRLGTGTHNEAKQSNSTISGLARPFGRT